MPRWPAMALRTAVHRAVRDPLALVVSIGFYVVVSVVISTLWRTAADAHAGGIAGYTGRELTWYLFTSEAAIMSLTSRQIELIGDDIVSGAVAVELLRPAPPLVLRVLYEVGSALPQLLLFAGVGGLLATIAVGAPPRPSSLALAVPSLVLAVTCNMLAQHAFAAVAFWIRDVRSTWFLYQKLVFILGGMLLPLEVLPDALHRVALWLPFMAMAYVPARLASGHLEPGLLLAQVGWLVVSAAVAWFVFAAGERRLQVVGG